MERFSQKNIQTWLTLSLFVLTIFFIGCEQEIMVEDVEQEEQFAISDFIQQKSYWEGASIEFEETFILDDDGNVKLKEND